MHTNFRIKFLLDFLEKEPNDAFTLYALALEYLKEDTTKALFYFEKLIAEQPEYAPTYYHLAQLYLDLEENEKAKATYLMGIEMARKVQDTHALKELEKAYQRFLYEEDF